MSLKHSPISSSITALSQVSCLIALQDGSHSSLTTASTTAQVGVWTEPQPQRNAEGKVSQRKQRRIEAQQHERDQQAYEHRPGTHKYGPVRIEKYIIQREQANHVD